MPRENSVHQEANAFHFNESSFILPFCIPFWWMPVLIQFNPGYSSLFTYNTSHFLLKFHSFCLRTLIPPGPQKERIEWNDKSMFHISLFHHHPISINKMNSIFAISVLLINTVYQYTYI